MIKTLKDSYQSGRDNIGAELIAPCLRECTLYRRGTGFFSSSALKVWAEALDCVVRRDTKIQIICSPKIDFALQKQLRGLLLSSDSQDKLRRIANEIVLIAIGYKLNPERRDYREKLLAYLIANKQLEIRFAVPSRDGSFGELEVGLVETAGNDKNMYHVKTGYFQFDNGEVVGFDGSFNESDSGLTHNIERAQVFRSWVPEDRRRLDSIKDDIDMDWEMRNQFLDVFSLGDDAFRLICDAAPSSRPVKVLPAGASSGERKFTPPRQSGVDEPALSPPTARYASDHSLWAHQQRAITIFLERKAGILEMATGTGKTRTALEIIRLLFRDDLVESVVIVTYGTDLLSQWASQVTSLMTRNPHLDEALRLFLMFDDQKDLMSFLTSPRDGLLIISREESRLSRLFASTNVNWERTLVVHDEVHGLGAPTTIKAIGESHKRIGYRLGLSATPEREYDEDGQQFIRDAVGEVVFQYPLETAIQDGILCEFDYFYLTVELTEADRQKRRAVYAAKHRAAQEGNPWPEQREFIELSKIIKKAELKPSALQQFLERSPHLLKSSIVYVQDKDQGDEVCEVISRFTDRYRTYYSGTDDGFLRLLANGDIDCLVACERLNEGIDIPSLQHVFLISSDRARLATIQRIGRCLRRNPNRPNKRAAVIDFLVEDGGSLSRVDEERVNWLKAISLERRAICQ